MPLTVNDLQPKEFTIEVKGVPLKCKPLRLSHALVLSKVGEVLENSGKASVEDIRQAERDIDTVIGEIIPELKDTQLDMQSLMEVINKLMENIQPADNQELNEKGVHIDGKKK